MRKIRVLIVDDSAVTLRLISQFLSEDPEIEVVATAENGEVALEKVSSLDLDLVTLDMEMPHMDGLTALKELQKINPNLPVVMCSNMTEYCAIQTLDALRLGAKDYVAKPQNHETSPQSIMLMKEELVRKVKFFGRGPSRPDSAVQLRPTNGRTRQKFGMRQNTRREPAIVAIGASTGGPEALNTIISALPADFPIPILIAQHMPPVFTRYLADRLCNDSQLEVVEAEQGEPIEKGKVYIAPGHFHMALEKNTRKHCINLSQDDLSTGCRPSVDVLFNSVAEIFGPRTIGVVLTGMGQDGVEGGHDIVSAGGILLAQDKKSSVVWGMPGKLVKAGLTDIVLPIELIASRLTQLVKQNELALT